MIIKNDKQVRIWTETIAVHFKVLSWLAWRHWRETWRHLLG